MTMTICSGGVFSERHDILRARLRRVRGLLILDYQVNNPDDYPIYLDHASLIISDLCSPGFVNVGGRLIVRF